ncbi:PREDICTED: uncharacterized protein LOC109474759 isoform X2 [Branchiostoma belcheri]|uniref:Uncharacterized protein LOC109474759 isoform X2 n=1 Tax=Branchiostoma belcheri TaxID=7741 RepID=A0A6P4YMI6_BRABE|nr:PREDICTED: uncharacterized protein LOC109474759 isoform X2 [Branchiostoma belcheri]
MMSPDDAAPSPQKQRDVAEGHKELDPEDDIEAFIRENYVILTERLKVDTALLGYLYQEKILEKEDLEKISNVAEKDKATELLRQLSSDGKCKTHQLMNILYKTLQFDLIREVTKRKKHTILKVEGLKAPKKLEAVETNHHHIRLKWEKVDDSETLVGYLVEQSLSKNISWKSTHMELPFIDKTSQPQQYIDTESYKVYDFRVKAVYEIDDQYVYSNPTVLRRVVAKLPGQPFPPRRLQVQSCNCNEVPNCVTLRWMGPESTDCGKISYIIEKSLCLNDTQSEWGSWKSCATTEDDCMCKLQDGLHVGSTYRFRVLAKNTNGKISEATEMGGAEIRIHVDLKESKRPHFKTIEQTYVPTMVLNNPKTRLQGTEEGSVILVFSCDDMDSLIELWEMYEQQKVHQVLQKLFVSEELRASGVSPDDLTVTIDPEDFEAGLKHLSLTDPTKKGFRVLKVETAHSTGQKELTPMYESSVYTTPGQFKTHPEQEISTLATSTSQMTMEEVPDSGISDIWMIYEETEDLYNSPRSDTCDIDIILDTEETSTTLMDHEDPSKHKGQLGHGESALTRSGLEPAEHKGLLEDVFQEAVKKYYELKLTHFKPLIWNDNFTLRLGDIYTDLELVNVKNRKQRQNLHSLDGLFKPEVTGQSTAPRCILIEGEAGEGKTTFLSKEALDAVSKKTELGRRHDIVLLIRLRDVREGETIEEMVWDQCIHEATKGVDVQAIRATLLRNESRVLFLLDGYDQLRPEARAAGQAIPKLLAGKMYPNSTIVITSRPSAGVQQYTRPDCHVHIMGFSYNSKHVEKYMQQYFTTVDKQELTRTLAQYVKGNKLLNTLMYTPMMLMLLCLLWEEDQEMVSTGTMVGLYDNLLTCLVRKCCEWEGVDMPTEGLPTEVSESLLQLGKLALEALLRNETLLDLTEVKREKVNWELLLKLGVVSLEVSSSKLHPRKQLNFSHKTFQEFLAGRYVAHASGSQGIVELLQLTSITKALELSNLLQFTCGCDSQITQAVMEELSKLSKKEFTNLQAGQFERLHVPTPQNVQRLCEVYERFAELCLNILGERQEPEVLKAFSQVLPIVMMGNSTNSREASALKYYIQNIQPADLPNRLILEIQGDINSQNTVQYLQQCFTTVHSGLKLDLKLSGNFDSADLTERLVSVLKNVPNLRALDMSDTKLTPTSLQSLVRGFRHMSLLEELDLSGNYYLGDAGMEVLQAGLFNVPNLAVLRLRNVGMTAVGMSSLAPYMHHLVGLREIDISYNDNGDTGLESLTEVIRKFRNMQVLILRQTGISPTGMRTLVPALGRLTRLIKLDISENGIGDFGLEWLAPCLHCFKAMKVLLLSSTHISDRGILALIRIPPFLLRELEVLDVSYNTIGDYGIVTLVEALCHCNSSLNMSLLELYIGFNRVTGDGLLRIAQLISLLLALTRLNMSAYEHSLVHLYDMAAMTLAESLSRLPALEQLDLQNISMDPAGFHAVIQATEEHPTLETFHYSRHLDPEEANITATSLKMGNEKYLSFIETKVGHMWRELAYYLDLDDPDIRTITNRNRDDKSRCRDLLMEWQKRHGSAATVDVLMRALIDAGLHNVVDGLKEKYPELSPKQEPQSQGYAQASGTNPVVLFLNDEYGSSKVGVSIINRQEACLLASKGVKVYSTVLDATQEDRAQAEADGVELIFPTMSKEDRRMPTIDWLTWDHQIRYPNLPSDVDFIVGHVNITSHAARQIKAQRFPDVKLVQVIHKVPEVAGYKSDERVLSIEDETAGILDDLEHADVMFSVGPYMYDYYANLTRVMKPHHQFLPKPSDIFSNMEVKYVHTETKVVLSVGRVKGMNRLKDCDSVAEAMGIVTTALPHTRWRACGVSAEDFKESKHIIQTNLQKGTFHFTPLRYTQEQLSREMQRAHVVLMPSRAEPFGLVGLEAIAAGVPVLVSDKSGLAWFLQSLGPEFDRPVVEMGHDNEEAAKMLAKRIIQVLTNGPREFQAARQLKEKLLASKYWEESHSKFLETFGL